LWAGTEVGADGCTVIGVGAAVAALAAVEDDDEGAGPDTDYRSKTEKSYKHWIYINENSLLNMDIKLKTCKYISITCNSNENHSSF
jgi:hypothetical protein